MLVRRLQVRLLNQPDAPPPVQNTARVGKLFVDARQTVHPLGSVSHHVARTGQGRTLPQGVRVKSLDRAREKAHAELSGRFEYLVDLAATTAVFPSLQALFTGACALVKICDIVRLRDRFEAPRDSGYSDMCVNIRMPNGHIVEFQLHAQPMFVAKQFEQVLYNRRRVLVATSKPEHAAAIDRLTDTAKAVYAIARFAMDRNRPLIESEIAAMGQLVSEAL